MPTPRSVKSAHLEDYRVISVSLADNHALFLADNSKVEENVPETTPKPAKLNGKKKQKAEPIVEEKVDTSITTGPAPKRRRKETK